MLLPEEVNTPLLGRSWRKCHGISFRLFKVVHTMQTKRKACKTIHIHCNCELILEGSRRFQLRSPLFELQLLLYNKSVAKPPHFKEAEDILEPSRYGTGL